MRRAQTVEGDIETKWDSYRSWLQDLRQKEESELEALKERKKERQEEWAELEKIISQYRQKYDDVRKQEEDERKLKREQRRLQYEVERCSRYQKMNQFSKPIFTIVQKRRDIPTGNRSRKQSAVEVQENEELKHKILAELTRSINVDGIPKNDLRKEIKSIHSRLTNLTTEIYDLEQRNNLQDYDMRELNERQMQRNRNKAIKLGVEPGKNLKYPPKILIWSKFDRCIDRRTFSEKKYMFERKGAIPCFPNVPPPLTEMIHHLPDEENVTDDEFSDME